MRGNPFHLMWRGCEMSDYMNYIYIILAVVAGLLILFTAVGFYIGAISLVIRIPDELEDYENQAQELRPEVLSFALLMELHLRDKDEEKGQSWKEKSLFGLSTAALAKASFMQSSAVCKDAVFTGNNSEITRHAVDVANYCMMIADVSGALEQKAVEASHA